MNTEEEQKMSDTPETDAVCWEGEDQNCYFDVVDSDFARKLERERDEARMALRELLQLAEGAIIVETETIARWCKAAGWDDEK